MNDGDLKMVARIRAAVFEKCRGCKFQDGDYCSWWRKKTTGKPPCQQRSKTEYYTCPGCGEEFPKDDYFYIILEYCTECGTPVEENSEN